jgi:hypothetical protein
MVVGATGGVGEGGGVSLGVAVTITGWARDGVGVAQPLRPVPTRSNKANQMIARFLRLI